MKDRPATLELSQLVIFDANRRGIINLENFLNIPANIRIKKTIQKSDVTNAEGMVIEHRNVITTKRNVRIINKTVLDY
jgi:hypothetical protein